tara:strand:+ start:2979 stop:3650 length:672 start_codon:yes stop_codon:yes gene_type:complete
MFLNKIKSNNFRKKIISGQPYKGLNESLSRLMKYSIKNPYTSGTLKNEMFDELLEDEGYRFGGYGDPSEDAHLTTGIGHLDVDPTAGFWVTPEEATDLLVRDIDEKYRDAISWLTPDAFNNLSWDAKKAVVNMNFRGDLRDSDETSKLIRQGRMSEASKEYLNHKGYEAAKKSGNLGGIVDRMEENARRLAIEKNPEYLKKMTVSSPDASERSHDYLKYWKPE